MFIFHFGIFVNFFFHILIRNILAQARIIRCNDSFSNPSLAKIWIFQNHIYFKMFIILVLGIIFGVINLVKYLIIFTFCLFPNDYVFTFRILFLFWKAWVSFLECHGCLSKHSRPYRDYRNFSSDPVVYKCKFKLGFLKAKLINAEVNLVVCMLDMLNYVKITFKIFLNIYYDSQINAVSYHIICILLLSINITCNFLRFHTYCNKAVKIVYTNV